MHASQPAQSPVPMTRRRCRAALLAVLMAASGGSVAIGRPIAGFGSLSFPTTCAPAVQGDFETAVARLHAFDGPEAAFRAVAAADPHCAMAWWGAAMTVRGNPLAGAPSRDALEAGQGYAAGARAASPQTDREAGLIDALSVYFRDPAEPNADRTRNYEAAMRALAARYPDDVEIQSFYALAILEAVDLTDRSLTRQRLAGQMLAALWSANPDHPGIPHYLIHAYDYPPLAALALPAARRYGEIAPGSMHALHMPSHIYSMLGLWQDSIAANRQAAALHGDGAQDMAGMDSADPHGMDFIAYAHLQLGQDDAVLQALAEAGPSDERVLVEARYILERGDWAEGAAMRLAGLTASQSVTARFVRALGAARSGQPGAARDEAMQLRALREPVLQADGAYWAGLVDVYATAADAWTLAAGGDAAHALSLMRQAADADDAREKHILLENKLFPMRELYGDMLLDTGHPEAALAAYQASLAAFPNRLNLFIGAARAAQALGRTEEARRYATSAASQIADAAPGRPAFAAIRALAQGVP